MPRLSWNEIERRAVAFSAEWAGETYEKGESQSFWQGFIDLFWPENVTDKQRANIEPLAQGVLDARGLYPDSSLADLYDPLTMPKELTDAHHKLDRDVDRLYQRKPFDSDVDRVALLFKRDQELTRE